MRALTLAAIGAGLFTLSACERTGDREFEVQKPVVGVEADTIRTPDVDVGMKKDTISVPDVDVDVEKKKTEVRVPDVDVQSSDEPDTN